MEALAKFFAEKFQIPGEESETVHHLDDENFGVELKTFRVKRRQVQRVLENLDESKSVGLDGASPRLLKQCAAVLSMPFTRLFQMIVRSGVFLKAWKLERVTPIQYPQKGTYDFTLQLQANICAANTSNHL